MAPTANDCPYCGGSPSGPPDPHGVRACAKCSRSWLPDGRMVTKLERTRILPWIVGLLMSAAMGAAVAVLVGPSDAPPPPPPSPAEPAPAPTQADLPAEVAPLPPLAEAPPLEPVLITPLGRPAATWTLHRRVDSPGGAGWLLGTLRNDSQSILERAQVHAVFLDPSGDVISAYSGFATRDRLDPGETSPVVVLVRDPVPHAREVFVANVREASAVPEEVTGLAVLSEQPSEDGVFGWRFSGLVRHDGEVPARHVKVEITAWDEAGRLSGVVETYADAEVLAPGQSAPFKTTAHQLGGELDRVEYAVHATAAQVAEAPTPEAPQP